MTTDYWYLNDIRDAVNSPQAANPEALSGASNAYNEACREANRRLREVERLLRSGLRGEAIQVAEQEPNLLDFVAELDLALIEDWQGMLAQWGMELPPDIEVGIAAELNVAYAEMLPLEQLMRQHRLLALARAPLSARLKVVRQIAAKDDLNPSWKADIVSYEQVRLRQIRSEIKQANKLGNLESLEGLRQEVETTDWLCDVPEELVTELTAAQGSQTISAARLKMQQLAPQLDRAYAEFDLETAARLADQWKHYCSAADLGSGDPLVFAATEALEWVERELVAHEQHQAFAASLAALENALDGHADRDRLETLYHKAERFEQPIPELLQRRVTERLDVLNMQQRRKGTLIVAAAALLIVGSAAAIGYYWISSQHDATVASHVDTMQRLVSQGSWAQALDYGDNLPEEIKTHPSVSALLSDSRAGNQAEEQRSQAVAALLTRAEEMDPTKPDHQLLSQLGKAVETPEEKRRLAEVQLAVRQAAQDRQRGIDQAYLASIDEWARRLDDLERQDSLQDTDLEVLSANLANELNGQEGVTYHLKRQGAALANRLRTIMRQETEAAGARAAKQRLFATAGNRYRYEESLRGLCTSQPDSIAAAHARQLLNDAEAWSSIVAWIEFWQSHSSWSKLDSSKAEGILRAGTELTSSTAANRLSKDFAARKECLDAIAGRGKVDTNQLKAFLIQNKFIDDVWLVIDNRGKRYYCPEKPTEDADQGRTSFDYFTDYSSTSRITLLTSNIESISRSPQAECGEACKAILSKLGVSNWDTSFYGMAQSVRSALAKNPPIDAVLAMDMLRRILATGSEGSFLFRKAYAPIIEEMEESGVDLSVYWFVPGDADASTAGHDARAVLNGLDNFADLAKEAREKYGHLCKPPGPLPRWIAVLDQTREGTWQASPAVASDLKGTVSIAVTTASGEVELKVIGDLAKGKVRWNLADKSRFLIGMPLFFQPAD